MRLTQFSVEICKNVQKLEVQQAYFTKINDIKNLCDAFVKFRRPDGLMDLEKRLNKEADKNIVKEALAKL